jgi:hypothetical protein
MNVYNDWISISLGDMMVMGIISPEDQEKLANRLMEYYRNLYPDVEFRRFNEELNHEQIKKIKYTYSGEETEAMAKEKMRLIDEAIATETGYSTPIIILRKGSDDYLLDGHRRVRVAQQEGLSWDAIVIKAPGDTVKFGIEDMVLGTVEDLFGK